MRENVHDSCLLTLFTENRIAFYLLGKLLRIARRNQRFSETFPITKNLLIVFPLVSLCVLSLHTPNLDSSGVGVGEHA